MNWVAVMILNGKTIRCVLGAGVVDSQLKISDRSETAYYSLLPSHKSLSQTDEGQSWVTNTGVVLF